MKKMTKTGVFGRGSKRTGQNSCASAQGLREQCATQEFMGLPYWTGTFLLRL